MNTEIKERTSDPMPPAKSAIKFTPQAVSNSAVSDKYYQKMAVEKSKRENLKKAFSGVIKSIMNKKVSSF
jgi:hypothetical protein